VRAQPHYNPTTSTHARTHARTHAHMRHRALVGSTRRCKACRRRSHTQPPGIGRSRLLPRSQLPAFTFALLA
jgi:hypothetical protein